MNQQKIEVARLNTTLPDHFVEVTVWYQKGDNSYSGSDIRRGFFFSIQPFKEEKSDDSRYVVKCFRAWSGIKAFIEPADRFNRFRMRDIAKDLLNTEQYKNALARLLEANSSVVLKD